MTDQAANRFLLDTTALLAHYRQETGDVMVHELLVDDGNDILICAFSITEMAWRLQALGAIAEDARKVALEYAGLATEVIGVDMALALRAFEIGNVSTERLPLVDAIIASAALLNNAVLVHRDRHFSLLSTDLLPQLFLG